MVRETGAARSLIDPSSSSSSFFWLIDLRGPMDTPVSKGASNAQQSPEDVSLLETQGRGRKWTGDRPA